MPKYAPSRPLFTSLALLAICAVALSACGRKPDQVPGPEGSTWPRSYPAEPAAAGSTETLPDEDAAQ